MDVLNFSLPAVQGVPLFKCRNVELFGIQSFRHQNEQKCQFWNQSGTRIRGTSPVPEWSGTGLRYRMPAASTLLPMPSYGQKAYLDSTMIHWGNNKDRYGVTMILPSWKKKGTVRFYMIPVENKEEAYVRTYGTGTRYAIKRRLRYGSAQSFKAKEGRYGSNWQRWQIKKIRDVTSRGTVDQPYWR